MVGKPLGPGSALLLGVCLAAACQGERADAASSRELSATAAPGLGVPLDSLVDLGIARYYEGDVDSARAILQQSAEAARIAGDTAAWARSLTWLGFEARRRSDVEAALDYANRSLDLKRKANVREQVWRSYNLLGLMAWDEGRLRDAVELFERTSAEASSVNDPAGVARGGAGLGLAYVDMGLFDQAITEFEIALAAAEEMSDTVLQANTLSNLGMIAERSADPLLAISYLERAMPLQVGNSWGQVNTLGQMGAAQATAGNLGPAFALYDSAVTLARAESLGQEEGENLRILADLYAEAGDLDRALEVYAEARAALVRVGMSVEVGKVLRSEAIVLARRGDREGARDLVLRASEIHRQTDANAERLQDLLVLAEIDREADVEGALTALTEARELATTYGTRRDRLDVALTGARLADRNEDSDRVLAVLESEGALADWSVTLRWEAEWLTARAHLRRGELEAAIDAGQRARSAIERVRRTFGSGVLRQSYAASRAAVYADLVSILLRDGRVEEAFEAADASRGLAFAEHVGLRSSRSMRLRSAATLRERERLLGRIDYLVDEVNDLEEDDPALRGLLAEARADYETFLVREAETDSEARDVRVGPASTAQVRQALRPGEALIEYLVAPDRVVLFTVRASGVQVSERAIAATHLATRVRLAAELMRSPNEGASPPAVLERLYETLIEPALRSGALDGAGTLYVVPHDVLSHVPFAALRDPVTDRYLVQDRALARLPSSAALVEVRSRGRPSAGPTSDRRIFAFAPFPEQLPATVSELEAIERVSPGTVTSVGASATEAGARSALAEPGIVHLATHGVLNVASPMFSRVQLRPGVPRASGDDGRLEMHEVLDVSVNAELVFLSGCETGLGVSTSTRFDEGEDYATLAQAFLMAGADQVVATLWRVEDEGAATLAGLFYRELRQHPPALALARAQTEMLASGDHSDPYYWAPYVLNGSGS